MRETVLADEDSPSSLPLESLSIDEIPKKREQDKEKEDHHKRDPLQADIPIPIFLDYSRTESRLSKRRKSKGSGKEIDQLHDMFTFREIRCFYSHRKAAFTRLHCFENEQRFCSCSNIAFVLSCNRLFFSKFCARAHHSFNAKPQMTMSFR